MSEHKLPEIPRNLDTVETPQAGKQVEQWYVSREDDRLRLGYLLSLPQDYGPKKQSWPLILFLHGAGERGFAQLGILKRHGPPKIVEQQKDFPFVVVSPQCLKRQWWTDGIMQGLLIELLDDVIGRFDIDVNRVYLTGISMGGYGAWLLAATHPDRFAAVVPICGGGRAEQAERLKSVPIWAFHGAKDSVIGIENSQIMVESVRAAGGQVDFTVYPELGHDSWTVTYDNPQLYQWLLSHSRSEREPVSRRT